MTNPGFGIYMKDAYYCPDCEWIGENPDQCSKCAGVNIHPLMEWMNPGYSRNPAPALRPDSACIS